VVLGPKQIRKTLENNIVPIIRFVPTFSILDYWMNSLDLVEMESLPGFDPLDVPRYLPYIYILEKDRNRLRYRVSGEEVNRLFNSSHTRKYLDQVVPRAIYSEVSPYFFSVFKMTICVFKGHVLLPNKEHMEFERVLLPVARSNEVQLLGTLALSSSSELRVTENIAAEPERGFHFTQLCLQTGDVVYTHKLLEPMIPQSAR
jgi:hypothetical protein